MMCVCVVYAIRNSGMHMCFDGHVHVLMYLYMQYMLVLVRLHICVFFWDFLGVQLTHEMKKEMGKCSVVRC